MECHGPGTVVTDPNRTPGPTRAVPWRPHIMSEDAWRDSATTDVLFPDDLEGYGPICVVGEPIDGAEADTDTVSHGTVAELNGEHHPEDYVVAPKQLRALIADSWRPSEHRAVFEVTEAYKEDEHRDDAPWIIEGRVIEDGDPL